MKSTPAKLTEARSEAEVRSELRKLSKESWDRLRLKIRTFSLYRLKNHAEIEPDDLLNEAILDLLKGNRKWPKHVALKTCLINIVKSKVSHALKKVKKESPHADMHIIEDKKNNILDIMIEAEKTDLINHIMKCSEDPLLKKIIKYYIENNDGRINAKQIAKALGVEVKDIYNANKRLKRTYNKIK